MGVHFHTICVCEFVCVFTFPAGCVTVLPCEMGCNPSPTPDTHTHTLLHTASYTGWQDPVWCQDHSLFVTCTHESFVQRERKKERETETKWGHRYIITQSDGRAAGAGPSVPQEISTTVLLRSQAKKKETPLRHNSFHECLKPPCVFMWTLFKNPPTSLLNVATSITFA